MRSKLTTERDQHYERIRESYKRKKLMARSDGREREGKTKKKNCTRHTIFEDESVILVKKYFNSADIVQAGCACRVPGIATSAPDIHCRPYRRRLELERTLTLRLDDRTYAYSFAQGNNTHSVLLHTPVQKPAVKIMLEIWQRG